MTASTTIALSDEAASNALGRALAALVTTGFTTAATRGDAPDANAGFTIHLSGTLGAGKTTVARALLVHLGVTGRIKSPTFALVERYVVEMPIPVESRRNLKLNCYHFDFYRFEDPLEWLQAGFRDDFADAALRLVEWPERATGDAGTLLPAPDLALRLDLSAAGPGRTAVIAPHTARGAAWLSASPIAVDDGSSGAR